MSTPHDALFKAVFSDPDNAAGAIKVAMPSRLAEAIHWPGLALCPGSFVDELLRSRHTDLLFSTTWRDGSEALLYLLFEHQSSSDADMPLRLLRYQVRIWERWRAEHPERKRLPAIIPVVLYHGAAGWSAPRSFAASLDLSSELLELVGPHVVQFYYLLDDLSDVSDEALRQRVMAALAKLTEVCFAHVWASPDPVVVLRDYLDVVRAVATAPHGLRALALVMRYIFEVYARVDREALSSLLELAAGPAAKDVIMTLAEELRQEGRQKGRQEGHQEGRQVGRQEGRQETLLLMLRQKFGEAVDATVEQRVAAASAEQLGSWVARMVGAATLGDVLDHA